VPENVKSFPANPSKYKSFLRFGNKRIMTGISISYLGVFRRFPRAFSELSEGAYPSKNPLWMGGSMTSVDALLADRDFHEFVQRAWEDIQGEQGEQIIQAGDHGVDNWTLYVALSAALGQQGRVTIGWFNVSAEGERLRVGAIHGGDPHGWVYYLVAEFFEQLRNIICERNELERASKAAGFSAKAAATGLAAWLGQTLGFSEPFAIAGAVVIILVLADATRGTFCKMTKRQTLDKIGRHDPLSLDYSDPPPEQPDR
jgi:hypothetical protein